jgi:hypothetical protein
MSKDVPKILYKKMRFLPIKVIYCSEVWGVYLDPGDSSIVEKFHMKFIKEILGVHCKASNVACRAFVRSDCEKYWKTQIGLRAYSKHNCAI